MGAGPSHFFAKPRYPIFAASLAPSQSMRLPRNQDLALLIARVAIAAVFIAHGYMKLFVMGHDGVTRFFTSLGIPLPGVNAWFVSLLEFGGGFALALGLFTQPLAFLLAGDMAVAIALALLPKGFAGGYEFELTLGAVALAIAVAGGGRYSLDTQLTKRGSA